MEAYYPSNEKPKGMHMAIEMNDGSLLIQAAIDGPFELLFVSRVAFLQSSNIIRLTTEKGKANC